MKVNLYHSLLPLNPHVTPPPPPPPLTILQCWKPPLSTTSGSGAQLVVMAWGTEAEGDNDGDDEQCDVVDDRGRADR